MSEIKELTESADENLADIAKKLLHIINTNPQELLNDEAEHILKPLGIQIEPKPECVYYYEDSQRLSVMWNIRIASKELVLRWALLAPPEHNRKMREVVKFVEKNKDKAKEVKSQLEKEGLPIHPEWRQYGL
jgi:hypothetical protein